MITTVYRIRIDFEYPERKTVQRQIDHLSLNANLDDKLLDIVKDADHAEIFIGNPACGPYIIAEYDDRVKAVMRENQLHQRLRKRKAIK